MKILLILLLLSFSAWAHSSELDSLLVNVKAISDSKKRLLRCHELSRYYQLRNLKISAEMARQGLVETIKHPNDDIRIDLLMFLGTTHAHDRQIEIFLELFQEAEAIAKKNKNYKKLVAVHLQRANAFRIVRVSDKCLQELNKVKKCSKKYNIPLNKTKFNAIRAFVYFLNEEFQEGLLFSKKAYPKANEKEVYLKNDLRRNLSVYYFSTGAQDTAIKIMEEAHSVAQRQNFKLQINQILMNLATMHIYTKNFEKARKYLEKGSTHMGKFGSYVEKVKTQGIFSFFLLEQGESQLAYEKALILAKKLNSELSIRKNPRLKEVQNHYNRKELEEKYKYNNKKKDLDRKAFNKVAGVSGILLFLAGFIFLSRRFINQRNERVHQEKEFEILKLNIEKNRIDLKSRVQQISNLYAETDKINDMIELLINDNPGKKSIKNVQIKLQSLHNLLMRQNDWDDFKLAFAKAFPDFESNLIHRFPDLTSIEMKTCIYAKAGLTIKEIAHLKEISVDGVKTSYKRLKKKMNIGVDLKLSEFFQEI